MRRTSQNEKRRETTRLAEFNVSVEPVADHDRSFRVERMPDTA